MAVSLKASEQGLQLVDAARRKRGWTKASVEWREAAQVAPASLKRFWLGRPINKDTFVAICKAVGVDWLQAAELQNESEPEDQGQSLQPVRSLSSSLNIDWRQLAQEMLVDRTRLTTNPLTVRDGLTFNIDEIFVPLGLVERQQQARRSGNVLPELGSQLYQPERQYEVARTFQQDEFFEQILRRRQSPISQGRRLAILGEPGAGKTTQLQKIADWVFKNTKQDIAIWIALADLQGKTLEAYLLEDWLRTATRKVRVTEAMQEALSQQFNQGRVWLLLDGLDEMIINTANPLAEIANQLTGWVAQARVVLTCRLNVWDAGKNALESFDAYRTLNFSYGDVPSTDRVGQFIRHWFNENPELGKQLRAELDQPGQERLKDMVKNPLRLALLCRTWARRQGKLPHTKVALYQQFAEALYEWKQERWTLNQTQRQELNAALGRLARRAIAQKSSQFRLQHRFISSELGEPDDESSLFHLALQLGWLNQVGVAAENPDEKVYAFFHPTFQEYFAAQAIQDFKEFLKSDNRRLFFEPQWLELIFLWLEREDVPKQQKENFIDALTKQLYTNTDDTRWQIAKFLGEIGANNKEIVNGLTDLLHNSQDSYTRCQAATSLGRIDPENSDAINTLLELLSNSKDPWLLQQAAESLEQIGAGNSDAIKALTNLLSTSQDEWTREQATKSLLGQIGEVNPKNSEELNALLLEVKLHPPHSKEERIALTKLIDGITKSSRLYGKDKVSPDVYNRALDAVLSEICQKIRNDDSKQDNVITWVNFLLRKYLTSSSTREERELSSNAIDTLVQFEDIKSKHIPGHPEANFQALAKRRDAGESWKDISEDWRIPISKLNTFYNFCVKHFAPTLKDSWHK
ncbi:HEAT repeat domain-containing protein [Scytonema sp. UIC 10036]|uniref:HEAT repeat domain-containing protein n=1 Tax=Scytonema sp. UIC 10036 TaxID=2304196 RepID=UPI00140F621E|nr:HEAT repeat domain-containing protein [Scytonema sp. UIC 10036]